MIKKDRVIGIDPDCDKSGVTELHIKSRCLNVTNLSFPLLVDYLKYMKEDFVDRQKESVIVVVEAGWMNESNWHATRSSPAAAAKIGQNTGRNHEVARKIAEMARHIGLEVDEIKPLKKCWKGKDGKITQEELSKIVGGLDKRLNQDARDSCILSWVYAGLPVNTIFDHNSFIIYRCNAPLPPRCRPLPLPRKCHRLSGHGR